MRYRIAQNEIYTHINKSNFNDNIPLPKDSAWPKISIVTPSYNQAKFLERCILSVLNQKYPNLEYILIDGGSSDHSINIIRAYEKCFSYWISEKDKGQSEAINKGFNRTTGQILAWLNSDDIYLPGTLNFIANYFTNHAKTCFVYGDLLLIDENDNILREMREINFSKWSFYFGATSIFQQSSFWRRDLFFQVDMLRTNFHYCLDIDLWLRMLKHGAKFNHISFPLAGFRLHDKSKTISQSSYFRDESINVRREILGQDIHSLLFKIIKCLFIFRKFLYFFAQGHLRYICNGIKNRLSHILRNNKFF